MVSDCPGTVIGLILVPFLGNPFNKNKQGD